MIKERNGNSVNFDEIEIKVVPGVNKYRMFDEGGYTDFSLEKTEGGYTLKIDDEYAPVKAEYTVDFMGKERQKITLKNGQKQVFFRED